MDVLSSFHAQLFSLVCVNLFINLCHHSGSSAFYRSVTDGSLMTYYLEIAQHIVCSIGCITLCRIICCL